MKCRIYLLTVFLGLSVSLLAMDAGPANSVVKSTAKVRSSQQTSHRRNSSTAAVIAVPETPGPKNSERLTALEAEFAAHKDSLVAKADQKDLADVRLRLEALEAALTVSGRQEGDEPALVSISDLLKRLVVAESQLTALAGSSSGSAGAAAAAAAGPTVEEYSALSTRVVALEAARTTQRNWLPDLSGKQWAGVALTAACVARALTYKKGTN